jgi:prepilin-type N-terminal cleavage/methylation domain-containing protein
MFVFENQKICIYITHDVLYSVTWMIADRGICLMNERAKGFTLLEVMVAAMILTVALLGTLSAINGAMVLQTVTMETVIARDAVRKKAEQLIDLQDDVNFPNIFANYKVGTTNRTFSVTEMTEWTGTPASGVISFPESSGALVENVSNTNWAMPRDLNGDGATDGSAIDRAATYKLLPCTVRVDWVGPKGNEFYQLHLLLTSRRATQ